MDEMTLSVWSECGWFERGGITEHRMIGNWLESGLRIPESSGVTVFLPSGQPYLKGLPRPAHVDLCSEPTSASTKGL